MGTWCPSRVASWFESDSWGASSARLLHVFPVFLLEQIGKHEHDPKGEQHEDADRPALDAVGLARVDQEVHEVAHRGVIFSRRLRALRELRPFVLDRLVAA